MRFIFKYKKIILYICLVLLFAFCLWAAVPVATNIYNGECAVQKIDDDLLGYQKKDIVFEIDDLRVPKDDYETIAILGKACAGANDFDKREVYIILQSLENTYKINARVTAENPGAFTSVDSGDKKSERGGFLAVFSSLGIPNGSYEMYIAVNEDADNYGIVYADKHFMKSNQELREGW